MDIEVRSEAYAQGYDEGYDEGWREASQEIVKAESAAYEEGFQEGQLSVPLGRLLAEEAREAGLDLLEGVSLRWDAAERRLVFGELTSLETEG